MVFAFISNENSFNCDKLKASLIFVPNLIICSSERIEGVPPPKNIEFTLTFFLSKYSFFNSISLISAFT